MDCEVFVYSFSIFIYNTNKSKHSIRVDVLRQQIIFVCFQKKRFSFSKTSQIDKNVFILFGIVLFV